MAAMQRVQPQLTVIREKYKADPARLNKEMMKLYKEEKINPMGGCLPMLLQIPLLWALFTVFRSTIEFRLAPFAFWIHDLSLPDYVFSLPFAIPIYGSQFAILPVLMAVSTFYQTKLTMTDPNQKAMLYMMPVMMLLFFNGFPSGLNLYYTLLNVWTFVQQKITPMPKAPTPQTT
jgi:YidC/Oxa1 family membrane protein insertase